MHVLKYTLESVFIPVLSVVLLVQRDVQACMEGLQACFKYFESRSGTPTGICELVFYLFCLCIIIIQFTDVITEANANIPLGKVLVTLKTYIGQGYRTGGNSHTILTQYHKLVFLQNISNAMIT